MEAVAANHMPRVLHNRTHILLVAGVAAKRYLKFLLQQHRSHKFRLGDASFACNVGEVPALESAIAIARHAGEKSNLPVDAAPRHVLDDPGARALDDQAVENGPSTARRGPLR